MLHWVDPLYTPAVLCTRRRCAAGARRAHAAAAACGGRVVAERHCGACRRSWRPLRCWQRAAAHSTQAATRQRSTCCSLNVAEHLLRPLRRLLRRNGATRVAHAHGFACLHGAPFCCLAAAHCALASYAECGGHTGMTQRSASRRCLAAAAARATDVPYTSAGCTARGVRACGRGACACGSRCRAHGWRCRACRRPLLHRQGACSTFASVAPLRLAACAARAHAAAAGCTRRAGTARRCASRRRCCWVRFGSACAHLVALCLLLERMWFTACYTRMCLHLAFGSRLACFFGA